jgi:hypothetical protein
MPLKTGYQILKLLGMVNCWYGVLKFTFLLYVNLYGISALQCFQNAVTRAPNVIQTS